MLKQYQLQRNKQSNTQLLSHWVIELCQNEYHSRTNCLFYSHTLIWCACCLCYSFNASEKEGSLNAARVFLFVLILICVEKLYE